MPVLTDRQRVELALPACLMFALSQLPGVFAPTDPAQAGRAESDIAVLREDLRTATLEPFIDLTPQRRQALLRRMERVAKGVIATWTDRSTLGLALMLWYFLKDLTDTEVLILWEGSAMDRAVLRLLPMFARGFEERARDANAAEQAGQLLVRLQAEGLYR